MAKLNEIMGLVILWEVALLLHISEYWSGFEIFSFYFVCRNGPLVELKAFPTTTSHFSLKSKALVVPVASD